MHPVTPGAGQTYSNPHDESDDPDQGKSTPDQGKSTPDQGQYNPDQGNINPDQGNINPYQGKSTPDQGQYNPDQGQYNPDQDSLNPDQGKPYPDRGKPYPDQGKPYPDQGDYARVIPEQGNKFGQVYFAAPPLPPSVRRRPIQRPTSLVPAYPSSHHQDHYHPEQLVVAVPGLGQVKKHKKKKKTDDNKHIERDVKRYTFWPRRRGYFKGLRIYWDFCTVHHIDDGCVSVSQRVGHACNQRLQYQMQE